MGLHYLTFMGRNLDSKKKLTQVWVVNSVGMNNMNIVNSVGIVNIYNVVMNSMFMNYAKMNNDSCE